MNLSINERTIEIANYIVKHNATVRDASKVFGIGKSTLHKDIVNRLPYLDNTLFSEVQKVFEVNFSTRHIRGGESTKRMYENRRKYKEKKEE